jgi:F-type H+-transporting ATPase subunit epsilon
MAEDLFAISLVTPERVLLDGTATEVVLRTAEGDVTFLAGHTPLVGTIEPGVVRVVRDEGDDEKVATHGGFVQVEKDAATDDEEPARPVGTRVTLLVGVAELAEEIDPERARAALAAAEARVAELSGAGRGGGEDDQADPELVEAEAALRRGQVRLEAIEATSGASGAATA